MTFAPSIELLGAVALLVDSPSHGLARGQVGSVMERLDDETVEVEFSDEQGKCYTLAALSVFDILRSDIRPNKRRDSSAKRVRCSIETSRTIDRL